MKQNDLLDTTIFSTRWSWYDLMAVLEDKGRKDLVDTFDALTDEQKQEIIDECGHTLYKGMEAGIMSDWTVVLDSAMDVAGVENMIEKHPYYPKRRLSDA